MSKVPPLPSLAEDDTSALEQAPDPLTPEPPLRPDAAEEEAASPIGAKRDRSYSAGDVPSLRGSPLKGSPGKTTPSRRRAESWESSPGVLDRFRTPSIGPPRETPGLDRIRQQALRRLRATHPMHGKPLGGLVVDHGEYGMPEPAPAPDFPPFKAKPWRGPGASPPRPRAAKSKEELAKEQNPVYDLDWVLRGRVDAMVHELWPTLCVVFALGAVPCLASQALHDLAQRLERKTGKLYRTFDKLPAAKEMRRADDVLKGMTDLLLDAAGALREGRQDFVKDLTALTSADALAHCASWRRPDSVRLRRPMSSQSLPTLRHVRSRAGSPGRPGTSVSQAKFHRTFDPKDWSIERAPWVQEALERRRELSRERFAATSPGGPQVLQPRPPKGRVRPRAQTGTPAESPDSHSAPSSPMSNRGTRSGSIWKKGMGAALNSPARAQFYDTVEQAMDNAKSPAPAPVAQFAPSPSEGQSQSRFSISPDMYASVAESSQSPSRTEKAKSVFMPTAAARRSVWHVETAAARRTLPANLHLSEEGHRATGKRETMMAILAQNEHRPTTSGSLATELLELLPPAEQALFNPDVPFIGSQTAPQDTLAGLAPPPEGIVAAAVTPEDLRKWLPEAQQAVNNMALFTAVKRFEKAQWAGSNLLKRVSPKLAHEVRRSLLEAFRGCGGCLLQVSKLYAKDKDRLVVQARALEHLYAAIEVAEVHYGPADPRGVAAEMLTQFYTEGSMDSLLAFAEEELLGRDSLPDRA